MVSSTETTAPISSIDAELEAARTVAMALEGLDVGAAKRVCNFALDRKRGCIADEFFKAVKRDLGGAPLGGATLGGRADGTGSPLRGVPAQTSVNITGSIPI